MASHLDPAQIIDTVEILHKRILERFPESNLGRFCAELVSVAHKAVVRTEWIRRPLLTLRFGVSLIILTFLGIVIGLAIGVAPSPEDGTTVGELLQSSEAVLSSVVILGAAAFFLVTLELRVKRRRALRAIHELRDMAHIVDMHQLTKDPTPPEESRQDTESSPLRSMNSYELSRYLDYCSEMLALISKIGALYAHDLNDPVVLSGVDGLQGLVDGLSQKLWNKLNIVDRGADPARVRSSG